MAPVWKFCFSCFLSLRSSSKIWSCFLLFSFFSNAILLSPGLDWHCSLGFSVFLLNALHYLVYLFYFRILLAQSLNLSYLRS